MAKPEGYGHASEKQHLFDRAYNTIYFSEGTRKCKICGKPGLRWIKVDKTWKLLEEGKQHICSRQ